MRSFLRLLISNPVAVILFVAAVAWSGSYSLLHLPSGLLPGLDVPVVNVISHYPGAAAEDIEQLVTRPIEDRLRNIPGVRRVSSTSIEGISQVTVQFEWGISLADARQTVQSEISAAQIQISSPVKPRIENIGTTLQEVAGYVVYGGTDTISLRTAVRMDVASQLMRVDGVSAIEITGGDDPAFIVQIHPEDLARHHLTLDDVKTALDRYNQIATAGFIERGSREYLIRGDSRLKSEKDILDVPLHSNGTKSVFVRDIAEVRRGPAPRHYQVHGNGQNAVAFVVSKQPNASTTAVVKGIDSRLEELKSILPEGAQVRKFYDQADIITEARNSLLNDLLIGALLASLVLFIFMGTVRATLIVATTIPIALLGTLALMSAFGQTLNVVTLSALTLAVGVVVDDAIIVTESIVRHLSTGANSASASLSGTLEIAAPDISGTFTTVAAFFPLLLLGGIAGVFARPFGLVLSIALLVSLFVSLTFVPTLLGRSGATGEREIPGGAILNLLERALHGILSLALRYRWLTVSLGLLSLGLAGLAASLGPMSVLPPIDEGSILIEYVMPPGVSLKESDRIGDLLEQIALSEKDVVTVYRRTGSPEQGIQNEGVNRGELNIKLKPRKIRTRTVSEITDSLRTQYGKLPGVAYLYHQPTQEKMDESLSGLPALFGVMISGPDMNELVSLAEQAQQIMSQDTALSNVINNTSIKSPQILVQPDPIELARCGLLPEDVFAAIQAARFGLLATTTVLNQQETQILVKAGSPADGTIEWLKQLPLFTHDGLSVPLSRVAAVEVAHRPSAVTRLNGKREITILAEVEGSIPAAVGRLRTRLAKVALPNGYQISFTGQYEVIRQTIRDFVLIGIAAILSIYLIMVLQFRSWLQPLIVLATIPIALTGAVVLLAVTRTGLDISAGMGALTLIGIAVNNAIVLLDYANRRADSETTIQYALIEAATIRLRPILMTAMTTLFALLPVALSQSVGSRMFQPFAITVIGGIISATAATLILIPALRTFLPSHSSPRVSFDDI